MNQSKRFSLLQRVTKLVLGLTLLVVSSCAQQEPPNPKFSIDHLHSLQYGMTESEVGEILGSPSPQNRSEYTVDNPKAKIPIVVCRYKQDGAEAVLLFQGGQMVSMKLNDEPVKLQSKF